MIILFFQFSVVNVALGKLATQSSIRIWWSIRRFAYKAVDGTVTSYSCTKNEEGPWWEVDLGEVKRIMEIHLTAPTAYTTDQGDHNHGLIISTRQPIHPDWVVCKDIGNAKEEILKFKCDKQPTYASRIRIHSNKKCFLQIREVEIFSY